MHFRRALLLAWVLAFQGCMCSWGQGDYGKGCSEPLVSDDEPYQHGDSCYAQGGTCVSVDNACAESQQVASDCYSTEVCCVPPFDASPDTSPGQDSEASADARSDADASLTDVSADATREDGADGVADAGEIDATPDDVTDAGFEASGE